MKKLLLFILLSLVVLNTPAKKIAEFDDIYKLNFFDIRGDDLYVVDGYIIKLFSIKDQKLIKEFGKKGEGPGEFKNKPFMQVFRDGIFINDGIKILYFSLSGEYINERKAPGLGFLEKVGNNFLKTEFEINKGKSKTVHRIVDENFKLIKELFIKNSKFRIDTRLGSSKKREMKLFEKRKDVSTDGNYIYLFDTYKGFYFEIYDYEGNKINTISKDYKRIKVSEVFKKKHLEELKNESGVKMWEYMKNRYNYTFPEYFPAFGYITGGSGKIYVWSSTGEIDKLKITVFNTRGNCVKEVISSSGDRSRIYNDKIYYMVDNEDEEVWELHVEDL